MVRVMVSDESGGELSATDARSGETHRDRPSGVELQRELAAPNEYPRPARSGAGFGSPVLPVRITSSQKCVARSLAGAP